MIAQNSMGTQQTNNTETITSCALLLVINIPHRLSDTLGLIPFQIQTNFFVPRRLAGWDTGLLALARSVL